MMLPISMTIAIKSPENEIFRFWLPQVAAWSILIILYIILLPLAAVAEVILLGIEIRPFSILIEHIQEISHLKGCRNDTSNIYDDCDQVL
jgi:hypothetical protein